jgi:histidine triad (HIT) family protein
MSLLLATEKPEPFIISAREADAAECVFCTRIRLGDYGAADDEAVSFPPLHPCTPGHLLVVSRVHVADAGTHPATTAAVFRLAAQLAWEQHSDFNLITSSGRLATQSIYHLHVHIVPRRAKDGLKLPWTRLLGRNNHP